MMKSTAIKSRNPPETGQQNFFHRRRSKNLLMIPEGHNIFQKE